MATWRPESVGKEIQGILSQLFQQELKDPRLGFVTITGVRMSRDLRTARVFISVMGGEEDLEGTLEALDSATAFLRRMVGQRIRLRNVPELFFAHDDSIAKGSRIDEILKDLKP